MRGNPQQCDKRAHEEARKRFVCGREGQELKKSGMKSLGRGGEHSVGEGKGGASMLMVTFGEAV